MTAAKHKYLRVPRDATFPTLPVPTDFQDYAHAYYLGAKALWEKTGKEQHRGVPYPDNLVYPILYLVHHFLELEVKSAIELTYSIGLQTGESTEEQDWRTHDLNHLLRLMQANLAELKDISEEKLSQSTYQLIEDIAKFGIFGEVLRYPMRTVKPKAIEKAVGEKLPDALIPDVASVIEVAEKAWRDFGGLISYLIEYEDNLRT